MATRRSATASKAEVRKSGFPGGWRPSRQGSRTVTGSEAYYYHRSGLELASKGMDLKTVTANSDATMGASRAEASHAQGARSPAAPARKRPSTGQPAAMPPQEEEEETGVVRAYVIFGGTSSAPSSPNSGEFLQSPASKQLRDRRSSTSAAAAQEASFHKRPQETMQRAAQDLNEMMQLLRRTALRQAAALELCQRRASMWSDRPVEEDNGDEEAEDGLQAALDNEMKTLGLIIDELSAQVSKLSGLESEATALRMTPLPPGQLVQACASPSLVKGGRRSLSSSCSSLTATGESNLKEEGHDLRPFAELQRSAWRAMSKSESTLSRAETECGRVSARTLQVIEELIAHLEREKRQLQLSFGEVHIAMIAGRQQVLRAEARHHEVKKSQQRSGNQVLGLSQSEPSFHTTQDKLEKLVPARAEVSKLLCHYTALLEVAYQLKNAKSPKMRRAKSASALDVSMTAESVDPAHARTRALRTSERGRLLNVH